MEGACAEAEWRRSGDDFASLLLLCPLELQSAHLSNRIHDCTCCVSAGQRGHSKNQPAGLVVYFGADRPPSSI